MNFIENVCKSVIYITGTMVFVKLCDKFGAYDGVKNFVKKAAEAAREDEIRERTK